VAKLKSGRLLPWPRAPYGYRLHPERARDPAFLQVDEGQAAIVQELFADYAQGSVTLHQLAQRLTERQVPSPRGRNRWSSSTIRGILTNPCYIGLATSGREEIVPARQRASALKPVGRGAGHRPRPREQWIQIPIPALVSEAEFDAVQRRLSINRQTAMRSTKHEYLLRGLVSCGVCRLSCTGRQRAPEAGGYRYYVCKGKMPRVVTGRDERCPSRLIPAGQREARVWEDLCRLLQEPERITRMLERAHSGAWLPEELRRRQATLRGVQKSLERQGERLLEAYLAEAIDLETFQHKERERRQRQEDLRIQEREIEAESQRQVEVAAVGDSIQAICERLRQGLEQASFGQRKQLVELLIDRVIVSNEEVEIRYVIPTSEASLQTRFCQLRTDYLLVSRLHSRARRAR
jgi:site-specific DNA recombinase